MEYLLTYLGRYIVLLFTSAALIFTISGKKAVSGLRTTPIIATLVTVILLTIAEEIEVIASRDQSLWTLRIAMSILGYILRPLAPLMLISALLNRNKNTFYLYLPIIFNVVVFMTAFFSPIAFYYDEMYKFHRGPLGYTVFVVSGIYLLILVYLVFNSFRDGFSRKGITLALASAMCIGSVAAEVGGYGRSLCEAIVVSCVFLYLYFYSDESNREPLTKLYNRQAFYDDSAHHFSRISAVATFDMNGLKALNDSKGHAKGDEALRAIGRVLQRNSKGRIIPYRLGGDEFSVLFLGIDEESVKAYIAKIKKEVEAASLSIAAGYAMKSDDINIDQICIRSDHSMYIDKKKQREEKQPS